jgi:UDP-N-acetylmuramyl tripeptide synthase
VSSVRKVQKMPTSTVCTQCGAALDAGDITRGRCSACGSSTNLPPARPQKICVGCGIDVAGKPRIKDKYGHYLCMDCEKKDEEKRNAAKKVCPDCKRFFLPEKLVPHGGDMVCESCHLARKANYQRLKGKFAAAGREDRKVTALKVQIFGGIALVIVAIILYMIWF